MGADSSQSDLINRCNEIDAVAASEANDRNLEAAGSTDDGMAHNDLKRKFPFSQ